MTDQEILRDNIAQIESLDPERYPALYRAFYRGNSSLHAHLLHILTYMQSHPFPFEMDRHGRGYWKIPINYLMREHGGSAESWQSHIVFLIDAGLLFRIRPDANSVLPRLREEWKRALQERQRAASCYRIVAYTAATLNAAEQVAARYASAGVGLAHITKTDVIRVSGQQRADEIFRTQDEIGTPEGWAWERLRELILRNIEADGYAKWQPAYTAVKNELLQESFERPDDRCVGSCIDAIEKANMRKKAVCRSFGCDYHPPRRADREQFGLEDQSWIITRHLERNIT